MASSVVDVYVKLSTGRNVQYDIDPSKQIQDLINLVANDEGAKINQVRLKFQGKVLVTNKTIREYGVRAETILKTEILVPKSLALVLKLPDDKIEEITVSNLDSARLLLEIIRDKCDIKGSSLKVQYKGQRITSSSTRLLELGIENCSEINVEREAIKETKKGKGATPNVVEELPEDEKEAVLSSFQCDGKQVEVVFSFDTTGSMYSYLDKVRTKLRECCTRLIQDIPRIRLGLIAHGDYCDDSEGSYVVRSVELTDNVDMLTSFADDVPSTGGGDCPECYEWVLRKAQYLDWSENSAKALVVIGDACPHPPCYTDLEIKWRDEVDILKGMGVKVYGVQAGNKSDAGHFYAEIADMTEGKYLKLNNFDIITDMFLAVCYREGNEELLEEFQEELEGAGRMTEQAKAMFDDLKKTNKDEEKKNDSSSSSPRRTERYVADSWWDNNIPSNVHPSYLYDSRKDKWTPYRNSTETPSATPVYYPSSSPSRSSRSSSRRTRSKKRCSVM